MNSHTTTDTKPSHGLQACLLAIAATLLIVEFIGSIWSGSVDLAHHYALVARIAEYWTLPAGLDPTLGEMNFYPRTSHIIAAIAGSLFDSPLIGIQLISLVSIIVLWASLIHILLSLPRKLAAPVLASFVALLVLNRVLFRFEIHGREIVSSFFYAQLVAQALVASSLALAMAMDRRSVHSSTRYTVLMVLIYFCLGVHLLPALQLLCFALLLIGMELVAKIDEAKSVDVRAVLIAVGFMLIGLVLVVRHPAFAAMAEISRNNGALSPGHLNTVGAIAVYAVFIAIASGFIAFRWFKLRNEQNASQLLLLKYFGLYGMAVSGLCLTQFIALKFGLGSEYAVKKHVYSLNTVMLIELALIPLLFATRRGKLSTLTLQDGRGLVYSYFLLPLLTVLAFYAIAPRKKVYDTAEVVRLERILEAHRDALVALAPGKFVYLMPGPEVSPVIAYMLTIGVLKTPQGPGHDSNARSILRNEPLTEWPVVGTILAPASMQSVQSEGMGACRRVSPELPFSVLDGQCIANAMAKVSPIIMFSSQGMPSRCTMAGFSHAEAAFTWTDGKQASIDCPTPEIEGHLATSVTISAGAFLENVPFQRAYISINGGIPVEFRFDQKTPQRSITLNLPADDNSNCHISMTLPDATSPSHSGVSVDPRQLGLSVSKIEFK